MMPRRCQDGAETGAETVRRMARLAVKYIPTEAGVAGGSREQPGLEPLSLESDRPGQMKIG
jgi:hypothetical protein